VRVRILAIEHVQLAMPAGGEAAARAFYADVLELSEVPKPPRLAQRGGCWFESAGAKLHLGVDGAFRPARKAHPALLVSRLAELLERCRHAGFTVEEDEPLEGFERAYVYDPFGNRIELMEPRPAAR
jgi:catechol 2,3-dioxygenase-like lactoylglutathione lyase family enzyme